MCLKWLQNTKFINVLITIFALNILRVNGVEYFTEKPDWFKSCRINEPGFTKCSTESVQIMMDHVLNMGIPEITEKLGPLDPMKLEKIVLDQNNNQAVSLVATLDDILSTGLSKMVIKESRVSKKNYSWQTKIYIPRLLLDGNYVLKGKVLLLQLNGAGKFVIDIDGLNIIMHTTTHLYDKGGLTFYNVTNIKVDLDLKKVRTDFEHLIQGNEEIERSTKALINENWRDFFEALRPLVTKTVEKILLDILSESFDIIPANFFIEDIPTAKELYAKT